MNINWRKEGLISLGGYLRQLADGAAQDPKLAALNVKYFEQTKELIQRVHQYNGWFTAENVQLAIDEWGEALREDQIEEWLSAYNFKETSGKKVGIIMAGNIPLVGFHDLISVLLSGHHALVKLSSDDRQLMQHLISCLQQIDARFAEVITQVEQLKEVDAVIATGSNNTARYFEHYFGKYPHIIRKNRTSLAIITGKESDETLKSLADDIFKYYGLGCRNVSKVFIPEDFDLDRLFGALFHYQEVVNHNKYGNNYDYNKAVYLLNQVDLLENGFILLKEDESLFSPLAVLHYQRYKALSEVEDFIQQEEENIQCVVAQDQLVKSSIPFGQAQSPQLWDYADGVDTMKFLTELA